MGSNAARRTTRPRRSRTRLLNWLVAGGIPTTTDADEPTPAAPPAEERQGLDEDNVKLATSSQPGRHLREGTWAHGVGAPIGGLLLRRPRDPAGRGEGLALGPRTDGCQAGGYSRGDGRYGSAACRRPRRPARTVPETGGLPGPRAGSCEHSSSVPKGQSDGSGDRPSTRGHSVSRTDNLRRAQRWLLAGSRPRYQGATRTGR